MSYLSRKEIEELKPSIDKTVYKVVGSNDTSVINTAIHCLNSGYDWRKTADKLSSYLDNKKATRLSEKIFDLVDDVKYKSRKRNYDDPKERDRDTKRNKTSGSRYEDKYDDRERDRERDKEPRDKEKDRNNTEKTKLSSSKIKEMMEHAQKQIEERKKTLDTLPSKTGSLNISNINIPTPSIYGIPTGLLNRGDADKARKIAQLQAQIKNKLSTGILNNVVIQMPVMPDKPTPLILDEEGRTVDKTGKAVQLTHVAPTLKANIRAKKREQFRAQLTDKVSEESGESRFFDNRISLKPSLRNKRALRFHEPGKFQQLAERLRMKVCKKNLKHIDTLGSFKLLYFLGTIRKITKRNFTNC